MNLSSTPPLHPGDRVRITHLGLANQDPDFNIGDVWTVDDYWDGYVSFVGTEAALYSGVGDRWELIEEAA